jgi:hypothetical protein
MGTPRTILKNIKSEILLKPTEKRKTSAILITETTSFGDILMNKILIREFNGQTYTNLVTELSDEEIKDKYIRRKNYAD